MKKEKQLKINIDNLSLLKRFLLGNFIFFFRHGILETTNRNIFTGIHIVNQKRQYSPNRISLANKLLNYAIYLNEYNDVKEYVNNAESLDVKKLYKKAGKNIEKIKKQIQTTKGEKGGNFLLEIEIFNNWNNSRKKTFWNKETIIHSRELMNAFHTYNIYVFTTGYSLREQMKCKTIEDMNRKYAWILNNQPEDIDQVAICILWNLSMIIQLIDDKEDFLVDEICMLPTFATVLNEYHFNSYKPKKDKLTFDINAIVRKRTFEEMEDLKEEYYQNAKNFGYKPILVQKVVFNSIFRILKILVRLISKLPRGPRYLLSRRLRFLRERWRAEGRFD